MRQSPQVVVQQVPIRKKYIMKPPLTQITLTRIMYDIVTGKGASAMFCIAGGVGLTDAQH